MTIARLEELEKLISIYDNAYHNLDVELIKDEEYDKLVVEYYGLMKLFPDFTPSLSPGFVENNGPTIPLIEPMLSITKFNNFSKFVALGTRYKDFTIEDKLDGVAVRVIYDKDGNLTYIHLKGNGYEGKDISHRRWLIDGIPDTVTNEDGYLIEVTGEVFSEVEDYERYIADSGRTKVPNRSVVSGFLRRDQTEEDDGDLPLHFVAFHASKNIRERCKTYPELTNWFTANGFEIPNSYEEIPETKPGSVDRMEYPIDGVVIKNNDLSKWNDRHFIGYCSYAGCFKYPTDVVESEVQGVTWGIDTRGYLNAVLNIKPVTILDSTVSKCTFYYIDSYIKNGIRIGSKVEVTKGNEIIPKLISMTSPGNGTLITYPANCPCCGEVLSEESKGVYKCNNFSCCGQLGMLLKRAFSPCGFNIDGLGNKRIDILVEKGILSYPYQIFSLTVEDLVSAGLPLKVSKKIINQVKTLPKVNIARWLFAAGIPELGETRCLEILSYIKEVKCKDADELCTILASSDMSELFGVDGLTIMSYASNNYNDLFEFFSNLDFGQTIEDIIEFIPVAITGKSDVGRDVIKEMLHSKGYWLDNKITKSTYRLLVGDKPSPGKVGLAERYDIPIIYIEGLTLDSIIKQLEKR